MAGLTQVSLERFKSSVTLWVGGRSKNMELSYAALFLLVSIFSFSFLALKFMNSKKQQKEGGREPPGPWNLPILGSLHHIFGSKLPHRSLRDLSAVYGPIMRLKLGEIPVVVISSVEGVREVMKTHDIVFATRPITKSIEALFFAGNDVIFGPYGEFWRQMRRLCTLELLSTKRVRSFRAVREEEVSHLLGSLAPSSGVAVNLSSKLAEISNNVTARAAIGSRCGDQELFFSVLGDAVEFVSGFTLVDLFPSKPFLGRIMGYQSRLEKCGKKLNEMLEKIVEEHVEKVGKNSNVAGNNGEEALMVEDLTDVLLRVQREGSFPFPISNDNIKAIIEDILMAGSETSSTLMDWAMSELIRNPEIMKKAQREVREVIGSTPGRMVEEEVTSGRLTYLQMVIKETLRLHPPVPLLLFRENQEICKVMEYEIPLKTTVMINMWAITRDAKYWDDPNIFWPERFEASTVDFRGSHFEFAPFGAGRRMCPGMQFGLSTVELVLAYLLYYFDWQCLEKELDMGEAFGVTTRRKSPLYVVPTLHFPLPTSA
ncbi:Premnaspirodiene oxygenase [Platanthera zijinensis]|uniref:Premnaspirodiene oxygenase n=1 Tax=Platanthera zijinensis TaxID=2320716 RepID=A0AAP0G7T6_9ASPA